MFHFHAKYIINIMYKKLNDLVSVNTKVEQYTVRNLQTQSIESFYKNIYNLTLNKNKIKYIL